MQVVPVSEWWRARSRYFQLALCLRLRVGLPELDVLPPVACRGCGGAHDKLGRHPSACKRGNRSSLYTGRHDHVQSAWLHVMRMMRVSGARAVGKRDYFGSAVPPGKRLYPDIIMPVYEGVGRHVFVDVAVVEPATVAFTPHGGGAADEAGYAAKLRAARKVNKYGVACSRIESKFRDAVMERYGALSDGAVGLIRMVCGAGEREPSEAQYSPTAPSRVTHAMQVVVFAGVMADAAMLAEALELDVWCRACVGDGE